MYARKRRNVFHDGLKDVKRKLDDKYGRDRHHGHGGDRDQRPPSKHSDSHKDKESGGGGGFRIPKKGEDKKASSSSRCVIC